MKVSFSLTGRNDVTSSQI